MKIPEQQGVLNLRGWTEKSICSSALSKPKPIRIAS